MPDEQKPKFEGDWMKMRAERDADWPQWLQRENPRSAAVQFARVEGQAFAQHANVSAGEVKRFQEALELSLLNVLSHYNPDTKEFLDSELRHTDMAWQHTGYVAGAVQRLLPEANFRESMAIAAEVIKGKVAGSKEFEHFTVALRGFSAPEDLTSRISTALLESDDGWAINYLPKRPLDIVLNAQGEYGGEFWLELIPNHEEATDLLLEKTNDELRSVFDNKQHPLQYALLTALYFMHDGWMVTKVIQGHKESAPKRYMPDLNKQMVPTQEMVNKYYESVGQEKEQYWVMILKDFDQLRAYLLKNRRG